MKNSKRFLSNVLAVAMLASMSLSSFAADTPTDPSATDNTDVFTENGATVSVTGKVKAPTMKVSLPGATVTDGILLNPYKMQVDGQEGPQVLSAALPIENKSDVAVDVFVKSSIATGGGDLKIVAKAPAATDTDKNAYLVLRTAATKADIKPLDASTGKFVAGTATKKGDVLIGTAAQKTSTAIATLEATTGKCAVQVVGQLSPNPTSVYTSADTVTVDTIFVVKPHSDLVK